jgi:transposase-like protein
MTCHSCRIEVVKAGKGCNQVQRYKCQRCGKRFIEPQEKPFGADVRLPKETVIRILRCLVEGTSVRATARLCDVGPNTVLAMLKLAGESGERIMARRSETSKLPMCRPMKSEASSRRRKPINDRQRHTTKASVTPIRSWQSSAIQSWSFHVVIAICLDDLRIVHAMTERIVNGRNVGTETICADLKSSRRNRVPKSLDECPLLPMVNTGADHSTQSHHRQPRPDEDLHVARGAVESHDEDAHAPINAAHECVLEEMGKSVGNALPLLLLV